MDNDLENPPVVMVFAGNDPTGGAGIQADIEALASQGCHAAPVITALTAQDTEGVKDFMAVEATLVIEQARAVLDDMPVAAFKIGMLGSRAIAEAVHTILKDYPGVPVVLDPVLTSARGYELADESLREAMIALLFPLATVLTPNSLEARALASSADTLDACAQQLMEYGSEFVLITGTHENTPEVANTLYGNHRKLETFHWERLPGSYHGSGCTLASAIAGMLAHGLEPFTAVHEAQQYTWGTLKHAHRLGKGQYLPNRMFWLKHEDGE
ncbi:MAG: bifunctional hydroxymethylpyrimidine kinase/phosphomethylpyrimidine kinase [Proteobacteria bacterium]|nr:bifunctional hydroxymethylpyrimidine kinase/phosphomethylpyrimidine kinase [Pseudomonadota bacterium]